jgi:hypothetical protein
VEERYFVEEVKCVNIIMEIIIIIIIIIKDVDWK